MFLLNTDPLMAHASQRVPNFTKKHLKNSPHFNS